MTARLVELDKLPEPGSRLQDRVLSGEYFVIRRAMQQAGVFDDMRRASLIGIRKALGDAIVARVEEVGFERIHEVVSADRIPYMTECAYQEALKGAPALLKRAVPLIFGSDAPFYYERFPNIRFHVPLDVAAGHKDAYREFGKKRGEGKITAHGPHRDSWLDCPLNSVNIWVAIGRVETGNGLLIYPESYETPIVRNGCHIRGDQRPGVPTNVALEPGDAIVFHGDQLHASVVNHTSSTRHVVSYRLTLDRPRFRDVHLQPFAYSGLAVGPLATGPLSFVSEVPASLQATHLKTRVLQVQGLVKRALGLAPTEKPAPLATAPVAPNPLDASTLAAGEVRAVDKATCVARLADGSVVAFGRRCPHEGADLSLGYIEGNVVRCPWHNLPFDARTGSSPCQSLKQLKTFPVHAEGDRLVLPNQATAAAE